MTRAALRRLLPALLVAALCLTAQSARDSYRNLYRSWREADPSLELDAASAGDALAARAAKSAGLAAAYGAAHSAALKDTSSQQSQNLQWLSENLVQPLPDLAPAGDEIRFVNREATTVGASVANFANDPDAAIQKLRQSFQIEQNALQALRTSILDRQQAEVQASQSASGVEQSRAKALQEYTYLSSALSQSADAMTQETAAWAAYYTKLAGAGSVVSATPPPAGPASASLTPRAPSITPVPLARYVGVWSFRAGSPFFGSAPEVVDVTVHEDHGHATGSLFARFKLPPGSTGDPVLRFDFAGDFKPTLNQTFQLTTAEGASGTIDLHPGVAFNELEVNFNTEVKPGKVHQGDILLLKQ